MSLVFEIILNIIPTIIGYFFNLVRAHTRNL